MLSIKSQLENVIWHIETNRFVLGDTRTLNDVLKALNNIVLDATQAVQIPVKNLNYEDKPEEMEVLPFNPTSKVLTQNDIWNACRDLAEVLIAKNHDYGNSVQDQFNEYGLTSILIRLDDKMKRLKTLAKKEQQVKDESLEDTLQDLAGYAELGLICLKLSKLEE